jgi:hypothetical protein
MSNKDFFIFKKPVTILNCLAGNGKKTVSLIPCSPAKGASPGVWLDPCQDGQAWRRTHPENP